MEFNWVEWFGYLASFVVLISLAMTSIIKLRLINLVGCLLFATFAYLIDSVPTIFMNIGIAFINLYFLYQIYNSKEKFKIINASSDAEYYQHFLNINRQDIEKQISLAELKNNDTSFYMLRDDVVAGVLVGNKENSDTFNIKLDYVTPKYRDYKLGYYYYRKHPEFFKDKGINTLKTFVNNDEHRVFLEKMGFTALESESNHAYIKHL